MAFMEWYTVAVDAKDYANADLGKRDAIERIRQSLNGLVLYCHALPVRENEVIVPLWELYRLGCFKSLTLHSD